MTDSRKNFVIATHGGLYYVVLDKNFDIVESQLLGDSYHYGVTVDFDASANSTAIYAYRGGPGRRDELPKEIRQYRFDGNSVTEGEHIALYEGAGDIHQITKHGVNKFLLSNSRLNSIDRWDPKEGFMDRIHINGFDTDINHINSIYPCLLYTSPSPRDATLSRMPSSA